MMAISDSDLSSLITIRIFHSNYGKLVTYTQRNGTKVVSALRE